jgi:PAS domain S-box-containing protein
VNADADADPGAATAEATGGATAGEPAAPHGEQDDRARRGTEAALRLSEERYRRFVAQSSEGIWRIELDAPAPVTLPADEQIAHYYRHAYLAECNDAMARMYGYGAAGELVGARLGDLLPLTEPGNAAYLRAFIAAGYRLTDAESHEADRDGNPRFFLNNLVGVVEDGHLVRAWGTQRDVTERRRTELERQQFASLAESSGEFVGMCDTELRPFYVNSAGLRMVGLDDLEQARGTPVQAFFFPEDLPFLLEQFFPRVLREGRGEVEIRFRHFKTGEPLWVIYSLVALTDESGRPSGFGTVTRDITDRKRAEAERERLLAGERAARAEAEAANRAKDEFLSIAAHELLTPVTALKGQTQTLQRAAAREQVTPERLARVLVSLNASADRLTVLTRDLLDVARLRTGRLPLRPQTLDLAAFAGGVVDAYRDRLGPDHTLSLAVEPEGRGDTPPAVRADPVRLEQVLANLLENAVKYSPAGGPVRVRLRATGRDGATAEGGAPGAPGAPGTLLRVEDEGIGLPPASEETIFQPFGRAANAEQQAIRGMGLGLHIGRQIAEAHGGRLWATSPGEGRGTTVSLWLPAAPDSPLADAAAPEPAGAG